MYKTTFLFTFFLSSFAFSQTDDPIIYRCPPCASYCDTLVFDKKGICHVCNMPLYPTYKSLPNSYDMHSSSNSSTKTAAILIFPGVQIIDFTGPWEVFGQAGMEIFTVAETTQPLRTAMGMNITPDYDFENMPKADIILVPGGNVDHTNKKITDWLVKADKHSFITMSVCNGAYFLGASGLLDGKEATTFAALIPGLKNIAPKAKVVTTKRFTQDGKIITSAGLSSGIDAALHIVKQELGLGRTQQLAINLEYNWDIDGKYVRANLADKYLQGINSILNQFEPKTIYYAGNEKYWKSQIEISTTLSINKIYNLVGFQIENAVAGKPVEKTDKQYIYEMQNEPGQAWNVVVKIERLKGVRHLVSFEVFPTNHD